MKAIKAVALSAAGLSAMVAVVPGGLDGFSRGGQRVLRPRP